MNDNCSYFFSPIFPRFPENSSIDYKTNDRKRKKKLEIKIAIISIIVLFFFFVVRKIVPVIDRLNEWWLSSRTMIKKRRWETKKTKKIEAKRDPNVIRPFAAETVTGMETTFNDRKHVFSPPFPAFRDDHLPFVFETKTNVLCQFRIKFWNNLSLQNYISFSF